MGRFKRERFRSKEGGEFFIFHPTIIRKGSIVVQGKEQTFVRPIRKKK